jgi:hypothetical protein
MYLRLIQPSYDITIEIAFYLQKFNISYKNITGITRNYLILYNRQAINTNYLMLEDSNSMDECRECYSEHNRITPLLGARDCLENHMQYICGTCGRCICIDKDEKRGVQRWNFPFRTAEIAKLYLRTADYSEKKCCGIYEILAKGGRKSYKIFPSTNELELYLSKNKDKCCANRTPIYQCDEYIDFPNTQVKMLINQEVESYLDQQNASK